MCNEDWTALSRHCTRSAANILVCYSRHNETIHCAGESIWWKTKAVFLTWKNCSYWFSFICVLYTFLMTSFHNLGRNLVFHVNMITTELLNIAVGVCYFWGFPGGSAVKNLPANAGDVGSTPRLGRSPWEGNGNPLRCFCLGSPSEEPGRSMGLQRVIQDWEAEQACDVTSAVSDSYGHPKLHHRDITLQ